MRMHWFGNTGQPRRLPAYFKNGFTREGASRLFTWEEPPCRPLPAPVSDQYFALWVGEHDLAVLVSLAPANPDDLAVAIKVADLRLVASDTRSPAPYRVARIARWPRFFGASSKALTSSLLRMTGSFFSYLGNGIRSISIWRFRVLR